MKQLTPQELRKWKDGNRKYILVDLREDWERDAYNIGGMHIPMGDLLQNMDTIPKDRDVVLYCEKGIRSVIAAQRLEQHGFDSLYNLTGGMKAWKDLL